MLKSQQLQSDIITIGTRGSMLALAQANWVKSLLEKAYPQIRFETQIIKTQGDQIQNVPLYELDGKDFFTKELDKKLIDGEIDIVVHSGKDLATGRPDEICIGAIPERTIPNDILLVRKETKKNLIEKKFNKPKFIIGTSSPRRIFQIQKIKKFIPYLCEKEIGIEDKFLRGNVDTRIQKLRDKNYDAIVLAAAGLERLSLSVQGKETMQTFARDLDFMLLPLDTSTPAPAQGALIIECRKKDLKTLEILKPFDHKETRQSILKEKEFFHDFGGTCHLPLGIYIEKDFARFFGKNNNQVEVDEFRNLRETSISLAKHSSVFIGLSKKTSDKRILCDELVKKVPVHSKAADDTHLFLSTAHCLSNLEFNIKVSDKRTLLCSGSATHKALAAQGYWCHASSYQSGERGLLQLINSSLFHNFYMKKDIQVLTHQSAKSQLGETLPSYKRELCETTKTWQESISECKIFYWTSLAQYKTYLEHFPQISAQDINHYTGSGKTSEQFKKENIKHTKIHNYKELLKALK